MKNKLIKLWNIIKRFFINLYHKCTKNYMTTTISISIALIVIGSIVLICVIENNKNKIEMKTEKHKIYYYFTDSKNEKKTKINYENDKIVKIDNDYLDGKESTVVYYSDSKHAIFPMQTELIIPNNNKKYYYSLNKYSEVFDNVIVTSKITDILSNYFIFDYNDLYFFSEDVQINLDGNIYNLSGYSYVVINSSYTEIYDYASDTVTVFDNGFESASATYLNYNINLNKDVYTDIDGTIKLLNLGYYEQNIYNGED